MTVTKWSGPPDVISIAAALISNRMELDMKTAKKLLPSQEELNRILNYNPETGEFRWRVTVNGRAPAGSIAGQMREGGYRRIGINGVIYMAHRLAWKIIHGTDPIQEIDHINGNPSDNRLQNLRPATHGENMLNNKIYRNNASGAKGVFWIKARGQWRASISKGKRRVYLGYFDQLIDAASAYNEAAKRIHGEFARLA